eukprot:gene15307-biopygen12648
MRFPPNGLAARLPATVALARHGGPAWRHSGGTVWRHGGTAWRQLCHWRHSLAATVPLAAQLGGNCATGGTAALTGGTGQESGSWNRDSWEFHSFYEKEWNSTQKEWNGFPRLGSEEEWNSTKKKWNPWERVEGRVEDSTLSRFVDIKRSGRKSGKRVEESGIPLKKSGMNQWNGVARKRVEEDSVWLLDGWIIRFARFSQGITMLMLWDGAWGSVISQSPARGCVDRRCACRRERARVAAVERERTLLHSTITAVHFLLRRVWVRTGHRNWTCR